MNAKEKTFDNSLAFGFHNRPSCLGMKHPKV